MYLRSALDAGLCLGEQYQYSKEYTFLMVNSQEVTEKCPQKCNQLWIQLFSDRSCSDHLMSLGTMRLSTLVIQPDSFVTRVDPHQKGLL